MSKNKVIQTKAKKIDIVVGITMPKYAKTLMALGSSKGNKEKGNLIGRAILSALVEKEKNKRTTKRSATTHSDETAGE
jgi:hypothetical protein